ncbi:hypothetical protein BGZ73_008574 [Actinomortierella ambigua]|nr:hypothetical protein BGZ73_008574 [Actinomortierella ambigua]
MTSLEDTDLIHTSDPVSMQHLRQRRHRHTTKVDDISSTSDSKRAEAEAEAEAAAELERQNLVQVLEGTSSRSVSKCFVVSALVVFGFVFVSSIPNILSANSHAVVKNVSTSDGKETSHAFTTDKRVLSSGLANPNDGPYASTEAEKPSDAFSKHSHLPDSDTGGDLANADGRNWHEKAEENPKDSVYALPNGQETRCPPPPSTEPESVLPQMAGHVSPRPPQHTGTVVAIPTAPYRPSHGKQEAQQYQQESITDSAAWHALAAMAKLSLRAVVWSAQLGWRMFAYVIVSPLMAVFIPIWSLFVEKPYEIVSNIVRAFLPVYTFFSAAAIIGVCVGGKTPTVQYFEKLYGYKFSRHTKPFFHLGILTWLGQIIITLVGASEDNELKAPKTTISVDIKHYDSLDRRTMHTSSRVISYSNTPTQDSGFATAVVGGNIGAVQPTRGTERRRSSISILKDTIVGGAGSLLSHVTPGGRGVAGGARYGGHELPSQSPLPRHTHGSRVMEDDSIGREPESKGKGRGYTLKDDDDYDIPRARYYDDDIVEEEEDYEDDDDDDDDDDDPQPDRRTPGDRWQHIRR